jgi:outer membrane protein assembly factor BamA
VFDIAEGDQFRYGKVAITGLPVADAARELGKLKAKQGDIFARNVVADDLRMLGEHVGRSVEPVTALDMEHRTVGMTFEVQAPTR